MAKKHSSRKGSKIQIQKSEQKATDPQKECQEYTPEEFTARCYILELGIGILKCQSAAKSWQALLASKLESVISGKDPYFGYKDISILIKMIVKEQEIAIREQVAFLAMIALRLKIMVPADLQSRFNNMMDQAWHETQHLGAKNNLPGQSAATGGEIRKGSAVHT